MDLRADPHHRESIAAKTVTQRRGAMHPAILTPRLKQSKLCASRIFEKRDASGRNIARGHHNLAAIVSAELHCLIDVGHIKVNNPSWRGAGFNRIDVRNLIAAGFEHDHRLVAHSYLLLTMAEHFAVKICRGLAISGT